MLTPSQRALCEARPNTIDPHQTERLYYLGNYVRRLPTNMTRMMENAYDWEHLPYVHPSSFSSIDLVASGPWGWRAKVGLPGGSGEQLIDLLVDMKRNYWATTVIDGVGQGTEIHTQATEVSGEEIEVDVRFYIPDVPDTHEAASVLLEYLTGQYRQLYDEDIDLMNGRQSALEDRRRWGEADASVEILIGALSELDEDKPITIETADWRYTVRFWQGRWIAHSAVCPHLLGPLSDGEIDANGDIACPWHGYRFNVETGKNRDGKCGALATAPEVMERNGELYLKVE